VSRQPYATGTKAGALRTRGEVEQLLRQRGATRIAFDLGEGQAFLVFTIDALTVHMRLPMPRLSDDAIKLTPSGRWQRSAAEAQRALDAETARRWRALLAILKAKFLAVDEGITTVEKEFLSDVLVDGVTVIERVQQALTAERARAIEPPA
jgi:hypothetical protein